MHQDNEYPFPDISLDESSLNRSCSHPPAPFNQTSIDKPEKSQILKDTLKQTEKESNLLDEIYYYINLIMKRREEIEFHQKYTDYERHTFITNVENLHFQTIDYASYSGKYIWRNASGNVLYYRINPFGKKEKIINDDELRNLFNTNIKIYNTIEDVRIYDDTLLLVKSLLSKVKEDVFFPYSNHEFIEINNIEYRNIFEYTKYLNKRKTFWFYKNALSRQRIGDIPYDLKKDAKDFNESIGLFQESIIKNFIYNLSKNNREFDYIMNWLADFYQRLDKSNIALVLIGDNETTDILVNMIIKPIFALREEYFCVIDDNKLNKNTNEKIIKDKIFYHVKELSSDNIEDRRTSKLIIELLKENNINCKLALEYEEKYISGQLIVSSSKDTPYPFLKDSYSRCSVLKVKHLETITKQLGVDSITLENKIQLDLENFTNILLQYKIDKNYPCSIHTEEKDLLSNMGNGIFITKELNSEINKYIKAIREKDLWYFYNIEKKDSKLYEELLYNFSEEMIAQPLLSKYFNLISEDIIFQKNDYFLDILKERTEMFRETPDDKSKYKNKKRYRIF